MIVDAQIAKYHDFESLLIRLIEYIFYMCHYFNLMSKYFLLLAFVIATFAAVPQLTSENFFQELVTKDFLFVKFFSPKCGHCVAMASEYEKLYEQSAGKGYQVAEVDCSENRQLCLQNDVKGFPTLKLIISGIFFDYEGARTAEAMSAWLQDLLESKLTQLSTAEAKKKIGKQSFVLVSGLGQKAERIVAVATKLDNFNVNYFSFNSSGFIKLYKEGSSTPLIYNTDQYFPHSLLEWAFITSRSSLSQFTVQTLKYAKTQKQIKHLLVVVDQQDDFSASALAPITQWCTKNAKNILCFRVTRESPVYEVIAKAGKASNDKTTIFIAKNDLSIGYHFTQESVSEQNLSEFFENAKADKIFRTIDAKREIKEHIKFVNIVKLTEETYNKTISENQVVFVFYYLPSCGHCVKFAPDYQRVGTHFKELGSNFVIAAVDAQEGASISKRENIQGYPHFKLFIRGNRILYRKDRNADVMIQFITNLSAAKLETVTSIEEIETKPFVALYGLGENHVLSALPGLFKDFPIYHIAGSSEFGVELHRDRVSKYEGKADIWEVFDWLDVENSPVLVSVGQSTPAKKLQKALIKRIPLLVVLNKHERSTVEPILAVLQEYCADKTDYVCGYVHKDEEDYDMLNEWMGDSDSQKSGLFWINVDESIKYKYQGELNEVTSDRLDAFISGVKDGLIAPHVKKAPTTQERKEDKPVEEL